MAKQSALHHWAGKAGASFREHHGWQIPARFSDAQDEASKVTQSTGLADVSGTPKFDLKGAGTVPEGIRTWTLGPRHQLSSSPIAGMHVTDVTSVFAQFLLAGPHSRDILSKLTSLNVSQGECWQTNLAHVHATVLRHDLGKLPAFHLLVARDYGESVWEAILHAGHEFHIIPFGLDALAMLEASA